jgi:hypothetical protein
MEILLIGAGIFTLICTFFKPDFYWESRKARRMRGIFGDTGATLFYIILGIGLIVFAIIGDIPPFPKVM